MRPLLIDCLEHVRFRNLLQGGAGRLPCLAYRHRASRRCSFAPARSGQGHLRPYAASSATPRIAGAAASMLRLLSTGVISSRLAGRELGMAIRRWLGALTAMGAALGFSMTAQAGPTLDKVKQAGQISCLMYAMPIR